jgi:hypothetical protein
VNVASRALRLRLRTLASEWRTLLLSGFGLTPREREGVILVAALLAFGLAVQWLRWLLGSG